MLTAALFLGLPLSVSAQVQAAADSILALVIQGANAHEMRGSGLVQRLFLRPEEYEPGLRDEVVDRLEELLVSEVGTPNFRQSVVAALAVAGSRLSSEPLVGIVGRLAALYDHTEDQALRFIVVGVLHDSAEEGEASEFLRRVATGSGDTATEAIVTLQRLGAPGRAVLQQLHAQSAVKEPLARKILEASAARGFRPAHGSDRP
jgi:hypothetical protein